MKFEKLGKITKNLDNKRIPLNSSQRDGKSKEGLYPYIGANNIMDYINEYIFDEKILCLAEDGGSWGNGQICANIYNEKCWVNNHAHVLTENGKANLEYLRYFLNKEDLNKYITGSTRGKLTKTALENILVPLPPIPVQLHIANLLSKAENLISLRKQSIALLDEFLKSTFLEMFGDTSSNKMKFPIGSIRDVAREVKYGTSSPAEDAGEYPYLRMNNITSEGYMDFSKLKYINIEVKDKEKYIVRKGDLLFNRTNSKELVGKTGVFNSDSEMVIAGYLIRVRTNERANPWYLWGYLNSLHGKQTLFGMCKSIVGMANINAQELQSIKILIPPIELQTQFAQIVEKIESLKMHYQSSLQELENLYGSLSQRAFRGELTLNQAEEQVLMAAEPEGEYLAYRGM